MRLIRSERFTLLVFAVAAVTTAIGPAPLSATSPPSPLRLLEQRFHLLAHRGPWAHAAWPGRPPEPPRAASAPAPAALATAPQAPSAASAPAQAPQARVVAPAPAQAPSGAAAPTPPGGPRRVVSSDINVSRTEAVLQLGYSDGRQVEFAIRDGRMFADGADLGPVQRGSDGDRAWRELLTRAMDVPAPEVAGVVHRWAAPPPDGALRNAILSSLSGAAAPAPAVAPVAPGIPNSDTLAKLESRLEELQQKLEEEQVDRSRAVEEAHGWTSPFRHLWRGISDVMGTLVAFAILFAMGLAAVFFGGRPYLEAVADTARRQTMRSWVVGLAGSFLVLPAFILGILALTISIVGIPVLLVFVPLFPVAVIVAALFGYLGVAHGAGEAMAERRLYGGDWFRRGNSYYFLLTGLGLLMALFVAAGVVEMAGPWLGFLHGLLVFLGVVTTWFAFTTGFGAVLLTRGGTRPTTGLSPLDSDVASGFEEETHV